MAPLAVDTVPVPEKSVPDVPVENVREVPVIPDALASALYAVIAALAAIVLADPAPLRAARNIVFDGQQRWTPRKAALDVPVRIVDIDNDSLAEIGQWPWPRTVLARLVERLAGVSPGVRAELISYLERKRATCEAKTISSMATKLKWFAKARM